MIYKVVTTGRHPYRGELYTDLKSYQKIKALAEVKEEADAQPMAG